MPVTVELSPASLTAAAGSDVDGVVKVTNHGPHQVGVRLVVTGEVGGWAAVVPGVVRLDPGQETDCELRFRLPRSAPGGAGPMPFTIRALPDEPGAYEAVAEGVVEVAGRSEIAVRLLPATLKGAFSASGRVAVDNLGQVPARVQLAVTSDDGSTATVEPDSVVVEGGSTEFGRVHVRPNDGGLFGKAGDHSFRVRLEPLGGAALTADGRYLRSAPLSVIVPRALLAVAVLVAAGFGLAALLHRAGSGATSVRTGSGSSATTQAPAETTVTTAAPTTSTTVEAAAAATTPTAPPGPRRLLFESERDGNSEVYTIGQDGSGPANLTNNPAHDSDPAWSPDGTKIAFDSDRAGNFDVYVMNADGSGVVQLTHEPTPDGYPTWSPDGTKLAFVSLRDNNSEIYVMNADGSGVRRLTKNLIDDASPVWSPDGRRIAFQTNRDGNYEIYVMNADGTNPVNVTLNPSSDQHPAWSPEGDVIAFDSTRAGNLDLYTVKVDAPPPAPGQPVAPVAITDAPTAEFLPRWAPDATRIVFQSDRDGDAELYIVDLHNRRATRLTTSPGLDSAPAWA